MTNQSSFSFKEAIHLILGFYTGSHGFWEEDLTEFPEAKLFINKGFCRKDEKYNDFYVLSNKGEEKLTEYILGISERFIEYMKTNNFKQSWADIENWFKDTFELDNIDDGANISRYICANLHRYGYISQNGYSKSLGQFCYLKKYIES